MEKILVLDVDETLLNMERLSFLKIFKKNYKDYDGRLIFDKYYLSPRPKVKEFIEETKKHFKLVAFSIVNKEITIKKLEAIGVLDSFVKVYGKEDLLDGKKSLKKVVNDLGISNIIGIDNFPEAFLEKENIIKINPWFIGDSKNDSALSTILEDLKLNVIKNLP